MSASGFGVEGGSATLMASGLGAIDLTPAAV